MGSPLLILLFAEKDCDGIRRGLAAVFRLLIGNYNVVFSIAIQVADGKARPAGLDILRISPKSMFFGAEEKHQLIILRAGNNNVTKSIAVDIACGNAVRSAATLKRKRRAINFCESAIAVTK